jgi:hypothetical protein
MSDAGSKLRRFRFSLRSLLLVSSLCVAAGFWGFRYSARRQAQYECDRTFAAWESGLASSVEACQASLALYHAESAMPLADRRQAADEHLDRVERVRLTSYGPLSEWSMGASDSASLARAQARKAEVERYSSEAKRKVDGTR